MPQKTIRPIENSEDAKELGYSWSPQPGPQSDAIATAAFCDEVLYGGAVFGGKTDYLLGDFAQGIDQGSAWIGVLFRQTAPELDDIISRSHQIYPHLGGEYLVGAKVWRFASGAELRLRHMESENDFTRYMGWSLSWLGWDELGNWPTLKAYSNMISRLRGPALNKRIRATANPGGRCHLELKEYFHIDECPSGYKLFLHEASGTSRMFIPSRVEDNKIGLADDPGYMRRLENLGDAELIRALRDGDWDSVVGSYFSMYRRSRVEVAPFVIPSEWPLFLCLDYGEENPTAALLLAVDFDDTVWVIDEYYRSGPCSGLDHARGIGQMLKSSSHTEGRMPKLFLAPGDMWTTRKPGEATAALSPADSFNRESLYLTRANTNRINGWRNVKDLLYSDRLKFFKGYTDQVLSSLGSVQRDPHNAEDVLKAGNDHSADALRYGINHVYRPRKAAHVDNSPGTGSHLIGEISSSSQPQRRYGLSPF